MKPFVHLARHFAVLLIIAIAPSCARNSSETKLTIAVSKLGQNYSRWLLETDSTPTLINLYPMKVDSALQVLEMAHALLVTGGEDVYPEWYGKLGDTLKCEDFDRRRDTLEIRLIRRALELNMPILGICRGHQIVNVALGGSLITDIPSETASEINHRCVENPFNCWHEVTLDPSSMLFNISRVPKGSVTSYHHQAIDRLAPGFKISAYSDDGLGEAIEWENPAGKSFLLGVQWHPERMHENPALSAPIAQKFIAEANKYAMSNTKK